MKEYLSAKKSTLLYKALKITLFLFVLIIEILAFPIKFIRKFIKK